jgi:CHAT domain-containing protein
LSAASSEYRQAQKQSHLTGIDVAKLLPADAVLVDFLEYGRTHEPDANNKTQTLQLAAFIVRAEAPIERVELGPTEPVVAAIDNWRRAYGRQIDGVDPGRKLRDLIWEPLPDAVRQAKLVIISPGGALARFPFAALPGEKPGTYAIETQSFAIVPVPALLAEQLETTPDAEQRPSLFVLGDVNYDSVDPGAATEGQLAAAAALRAGSEDNKWTALPGTRAEADAIKNAFAGRFPEAEVADVRQSEATETRARQEMQRHSFLHLGTHGYFAPPEMKSVSQESSQSASSNSGQNARGTQAGFYPGLLSGVVLAGANQPLEASRDDGILTALEVAALDLSDVELVTLSACETGLGEYAGGEGLLGLQRSLQTAGARSVVTGLWKVSDRATQLLMEQFYANLWQKKMSRVEALRQAQLWMLREAGADSDLLRGGTLEEDVDPDADGRLSPYFWAAFELSGDWR